MSCVCGCSSVFLPVGLRCLVQSPDSLCHLDALEVILFSRSDKRKLQLITMSDVLAKVRRDPKKLGDSQGFEAITRVGQDDAVANSGVVRAHGSHRHGLSFFR